MLFNILNDAVQSTLLKIKDKFLTMSEGNGYSPFYVNLWSIFTRAVIGSVWSVFFFIQPTETEIFGF